ncbi:MAG: ATP-dependent DNA helicase [Candidatus Bathyarchaeota archaeon]|nr:ATP-dependent DNA helicase [Candidatus Bathyarchaeota archaeon]
MYACRLCGRIYTPEEFEENHFCHSCEAFLMDAKKVSRPLVYRSVERSTEERNSGKLGEMEWLPETYETREAQMEFIEEASNAVKNSQVFIGSAPCGIGKSLAALLVVLPLLRKDKLLICFRTRGQLHIYLKELRALNRNISVASLFSKQDMCPRRMKRSFSQADFLEECNRLKDNCESLTQPYCRYYKNTYTRKREAEKLALDCTRSILAPMDAVKRMAKEGFCAYEALKRTLKTVNIFLGTYHYIFDPPIRKALLTSLKADLSKTYMIVDEAHNLPSFSRELLSSKLTANSVRRALTETRKFHHESRSLVRKYLGLLDEDILQRVNGALKKGELKQISSQRVSDLFLERVGVSGSDASEVLLDYGEYVKEKRWEMGRERMFSFNYHVGRFLERFFEKNGTQYIHLIRKNWDNDVFLEVRSFDGRELTDPVLRQTQGSILMSGSLSPPKVYGDLTLYESSDVYCKEFDSPFPAKNRLILAANDVSSKFENRTERTLNRWSNYIEAIDATNKGNMAVFFTSYGMMHRLLPLIKTNRKVIVESRDTKRREVMEKLTDSSNNALFGVMGAKFSEGIDYPHNLLTCVVAVGLPYATWTIYEKGLIQYFDQHFPEKGRIYGYLVPAILRLVQTCGRVHRSARDKGCIVILDERVTRSDIIKYLPGYFQKEMRTVASPSECGELVEGFWRLHQILSI